MAAPQEAQKEANKPSDILSLPTTLRIISLNCWGLKFISKHRHARLVEIGHQLASASPPPDIVGLQECWTQEDYLAIRDLTRDVLPHGKFYWSGVFGGGLAILSRWPIEESSMYRYPLNGRPAAFWRGDWYVGKGVACARIRYGRGRKEVIEVFNTHLHAPYEREPNDSYICHRTAQAWEIAKLMRHARERGHVVVGLGDFNMVPGSLAWRIIDGAGVRDVWREKWPDSAEGSAERGGMEVCSSRDCLERHGTTCDSRLNTWRWSKALQKDLNKGKDTYIDPEEDDPKAKRLDYIFFADNAEQTGYAWRVEDVQVGMTMRHPTLKCSLSDHFSVETILIRTPPTTTTNPSASLLDTPTYTLIQSMIHTYDLRERRQRTHQLLHWWISVPITLGCLVAVWWSPHNYVAFILMLLSTFGLGTGILAGLMGFLFVKTELRALKEFRWEVDQAAGRAKAAEEGRGDIGNGAVGERLREVEREKEDVERTL